MARCLFNTPWMDLDTADRNGKYLEDITNMKEILELRWTFRSVQQRMILRDSLLNRHSGSVPSLQSLSRDAVLLILSTNNTQERLVWSYLWRTGRKKKSQLEREKCY